MPLVVLGTIGLVAVLPILEPQQGKEFFESKVYPSTGIVSLVVFACVGAGALSSALGTTGDEGGLPEI